MGRGSDSRPILFFVLAFDGGRTRVHYLEFTAMK